MLLANSDFEKEKIGKISASMFHELVDKKKMEPVLDLSNIKKSREYLDELKIDKIFGIKKKAYGRALEHGKMNEANALADFSGRTGFAFEDLFEVFIKLKGFEDYAGCSPDGFYWDENGSKKLIEVKCPVSNTVQYNHFKHGNLKKSNKDYWIQCQFQMFVTGIDVCTFYSFFCLADEEGNYLPLNEEKYRRYREDIPKDEDFHKKIKEAMPMYIEYLDGQKLKEVA
jgi:hypothetical protein